MSNALIIIDMQPEFEASRGKAILDEHVKQIRNAIKNKHHIVIIEFKDSGNTHKRIRQAVRSYDSVGYITKNTCSGSLHLIKYFTKLGLWPKEISFMGVNTGACVGDTVTNFHRHVKKNKKNTKIKIIREGCRCETTKNYGRFDRFKNLGIKVV
jgi:hypothetical protein